jgi:hypothetical protein
MQENLSKTGDPKAPLRDREFYELRLFEKTNQLGTRYCVGLTHAQWSDLDRDVMFEGEEVDCFRNLKEAQQRYAERRLVLVEKGFCSPTPRGQTDAARGQ